MRLKGEGAEGGGGLPPAVRELAMAIDEYKLRHRRRFISYEEIYAVILELGYHKD